MCSLSCFQFSQVLFHKSFTEEERPLNLQPVRFLAHCVSFGCIIRLDCLRVIYTGCVSHGIYARTLFYFILFHYVAVYIHLYVPDLMTPYRVVACSFAGDVKFKCLCSYLLLHASLSLLQWSHNIMLFADLLLLRLMVRMKMSPPKDRELTRWRFLSKVMIWSF